MRAALAIALYVASVIEAEGIDLKQKDRPSEGRSRVAADVKSSLSGTDTRRRTIRRKTYRSPSR